MRLLLRAASLTSAFLLALLCAAPAAAEPNDSEISAAIRSSLVYLQSEYTARVQVPLRSGPQWTPPLTVQASCTGYIVDPAGYVATAGHCVNGKEPTLLDDFRAEAVRMIGQSQNASDSWIQQNAQVAIHDKWPVAGESGDDGAAVTVKLRQADGAGQVFADWVPVSVVAFQTFEQGDNAVVRIAAPPKKLPALAISDRAPEPGQDVVSAGFPGAVQLTNDSDKLAQPSFQFGKVSSRQTADSGLYRTEISATLGKGMSGGPTVDAQSRVIGTNSAYAALTDDKATFNFITDNIALRPFLTQNGVTLAAVDAAPSSSFPGRWLWIGVGIAVAVVVVVIAAVTVLLRRRRRRTPAGPPPGPAPFGPVGGPPGPRPYAGSPVAGPPRGPGFAAPPRPGGRPGPQQAPPRPAPPRPPMPARAAPVPPPPREAPTVLNQPRPGGATAGFGEQPTVLDQPRPVLPADTQGSAPPGGGSAPGGGPSR
ncbi:S1 family peptidase [Gordonia sp. FQ]|uniref:S1 family peptidase n=1 Tax=Gordonia sp. FQ TaxID=3446634 RepID=UPI003F86DC53